MSKILPTWEAVFLAADAEIDAFESAALALGSNIRDIKVSMTQKLYEELKNEMKGSESLFDTLLGLGLNALTGYVAASAARLLVSNVVRGWTVVTTVRTAPIVFKTGGNKYVHGIEAAKMLSDLAPLTAAKVLDGVRRKDVIDAILDDKKPFSKVYTRVEDLLKETMGAVGNVMTDKLSGSSKDDKKTKVSPSDGQQKSIENSEIQALIDAMPKTSEESRFLKSLLSQVQKSRRIIADMKTIIFNVKSLDEELDKKLREQWDKSELAIEHLAGDKSGAQPHRIKPEYSKPLREMSQEFLFSLLLNQWTNSLSFILFGPSSQIGNISKDAYRMPHEVKANGPWMGNKQYALGNDLVSNRPIRMYHPHWWSNNKKARSAYKVPNR